MGNLNLNSNLNLNFFLEHEGPRSIFTKEHEVFFNAVVVVGEGHEKPLAA